MLKLDITSQLTRKERKRLIATSQHSKLFKRRTSRPFDLLLETTTKRHNKMKESSHPVQAQNFPTATNFESLRQTSSAHRGLSLNRQARPEPGPATSPFQSAHFLAQHVHGHVTAQCHLCHLPVLEGERDFITRSMQSHDIQRLIAHVVCLIAIRSFTSALQLWDSKAIPDERVEGVPVWHKCRLLLNQKEEKLAMRPKLPWWDVPLRGSCA